MMKKVFVLFAAFILFMLISCSKKEMKTSENYLSGRWEQQPPDTMMFYVGSYRTYTFYKDFFQAYIIYWSDVIIAGDPCMAGPEDYIKGTYSRAGDSIKFTGKMCDSLYRSLKPDCAGATDYREEFKVKILNDTTMVLNPEEAYHYGDIVLKRR